MRVRNLALTPVSCTLPRICAPLKQSWRICWGSSPSRWKVFFSPFREGEKPSPQSSLYFGSTRNFYFPCKDTVYRSLSLSCLCSFIDALEPSRPWLAIHLHVYDRISNTHKVKRIGQWPPMSPSPGFNPERDSATFASSGLFVFPLMK